MVMEIQWPWWPLYSPTVTFPLNVWQKSFVIAHADSWTWLNQVSVHSLNKGHCVSMRTWTNNLKEGGGIIGYLGYCIHQCARSYLGWPGIGNVKILNILCSLRSLLWSCNATDDLRMDEFHKLEQRLIERGLHAAWNLFNTGENDIED